MSERFPDFDVTKTRVPAGGRKQPRHKATRAVPRMRTAYLFRSTECTEQAEQAIVSRVVEAAPDKEGQSLWFEVRRIVLGMVERGEIVRIGLTWDIP